MPPSIKALRLISQHIDDMWRVAKNVDEIASFAPYVVAADNVVPSILKEGFKPKLGNNTPNIWIRNRNEKLVTPEWSNTNTPVYGAVLPEENPMAYASSNLLFYGKNSRSKWGENSSNPVLLKLYDSALERSTIFPGDLMAHYRTPNERIRGFSYDDVLPATPENIRQQFSRVYPYQKDATNVNNLKPYLEMQYWGDKAPDIIKEVQWTQGGKPPEQLMEAATNNYKPLSWQELDTERYNRTGERYFYEQNNSQDISNLARKQFRNY
jgi:hypothetical protein